MDASEPRIPRVDFLVVGAMKCGTTTLRRALAAHPDVHMPERELHFFDDHDRYLSVWRNGRIDAAAMEEAYGRHYRTGKPFRGDKTPNYMISPVTVERIHRFHPEARLVVMVRDPIPRAVSHWNHLQRQLSRGRVPEHVVGGTFAEHLRADQAQLEAARSPNDVIPGTNILHRGLYAAQIRRLRRFFPEERVFLGVLDDLHDHPEAFLRRLLDHLGVSFDPVVVETAAERDTPDGPRHELTEAERVFLRDFYADSVRDLETLLGRDLGWCR